MIHCIALKKFKHTFLARVSCHCSPETFGKYDITREWWHMGGTGWLLGWKCIVLAWAARHYRKGECVSSCHFPVFLNSTHPPCISAQKVLPPNVYISFYSYTTSLDFNMQPFSFFFIHVRQHDRICSTFSLTPEFPRVSLFHLPITDILPFSPAWI